MAVNQANYESAMNNYRRAFFGNSKRLFTGQFSAYVTPNTSRRSRETRSVRRGRLGSVGGVVFEGAMSRDEL